MPGVREAGDGGGMAAWARRPIAPPAARRIAFLLLAAIAGLVYAGLMALPFDRAHLNNDSAQYVVTARHVLAGDGVVTHLQTYPAQQAGPPPVVQRVWPPVYPLALAGTAAVTGLSVERVAVLLGFWCLFMTAAVIVVLARDAGLPHALAALPAVLWLALPLPVAAAGQGQSEPLFALATAAALLPLGWRGRRPEDISVAAAVLCGLGFALAFQTRYQAIAFVAALAALAVLTIARRRRVPALAWIAIVPSAVVAVTLVANWLATGSARAGSDARGAFDLHAVLWRLQYGLREALGLDADLPLALPALATLAVVAGWILWTVARAGPSAALVRVADWRSGAVAAVLVLALIAFHVVLAVASPATYPFEGRYLIGGLPLAMLACACGLRVAWLGVRTRAARAVAAVLLAATGAALAVALSAAWRDRGLPGAPPARAFVTSLQEALDSPVEGVPLADWLRARTSARSGVLAADGQMLGLLIDRPVAALTDPAYSATVWTPDAVHALACRVGARWLVVFPWALQAQADGRTSDDVIVRMARGESDFGWPVRAASTAVRIYEVCAPGAPAR